MARPRRRRPRRLRRLARHGSPHVFCCLTAAAWGTNRRRHSQHRFRGAFPPRSIAKDGRDHPPARHPPRGGGPIQAIRGGSILASVEGEPGRDDKFSIECNGYEADNVDAPPLAAGGELDGGNIQRHGSKPSVSRASACCSADTSGCDSTAADRMSATETEGGSGEIMLRGQATGSHAEGVVAAMPHHCGRNITTGGGGWKRESSAGAVSFISRSPRPRTLRSLGGRTARVPASPCRSAARAGSRGCARAPRPDRRPA